MLARVLSLLVLLTRCSPRGRSADVVTATDAELHEHYRPGRWVPHCSVAPRAPSAQLPVLVSAVYEVLPLEARLDRVALIDSATGGFWPVPASPQECFRSYTDFGPIHARSTQEPRCLGSPPVSMTWRWFGSKARSGSRAGDEPNLAPGHLCCSASCQGARGRVLSISVASDPVFRLINRETHLDAACEGCHIGPVQQSRLPD